MEGEASSIEERVRQIEARVLGQPPRDGGDGEGSPPAPLEKGEEEALSRELETFITETLDELEGLIREEAADEAEIESLELEKAQLERELDTLDTVSCSLNIPGT